MACPVGFSTNIFYLSDNIYYPYVCYTARSAASSRSFWGAKSYCDNLISGSSLIRVRNLIEQSIAVLYANTNVVDQMWTDSFTTTTSLTFYWGDGSPVTLFCGSQPNNSGGTPSFLSQEAVRLELSGCLNDWDGSSALCFVCQYGIYFILFIC